MIIHYTVVYVVTNAAWTVSELKTFDFLSLSGDNLLLCDKIHGWRYREYVVDEHGRPSPSNMMRREGFVTWQAEFFMVLTNSRN